jgi:hypothetical protein
VEFFSTSARNARRAFSAGCLAWPSGRGTMASATATPGAIRALLTVSVPQTAQTTIARDINVSNAAADWNQLSKACPSEHLSA